MARLPVQPDREYLSDEDLDRLLDGEADEHDPAAMEGLQGVPNLRPDGTPRPINISAEESRERRQVMAQLLMAGAGMDDIIHTFSALTLPDPNAPGGVKPGFAMGEERIRALADEVRRMWLDEDRDNAPTKRSAAVRRIQGHIRKAAQKGAFQAVAVLEKTLAQVEGTIAPTQIEISGSMRFTDAVAAVLGELDPDEVRALIRDESTRMQLAAQNAIDATPKDATQQPSTRLIKRKIDRAEAIFDAVEK